MSASDRETRLAYVDTTAAQLWPGGTGSMVVLPGRRRPRLLAPARPRRAAAAAAIRYTAQQGPAGRLAGVGLAGAVLAGLRSRNPAEPGPRAEAGADSVDDHLGAALGGPVVSALALTAARANRKPVLQVFDHRGRTIAFAKVGVDPLTRALVDHEAATLRGLADADLDGLRIPAVLHHGDWRGHRVLVLSVLPVGRRLGPESAPLHRAVRAIARTGETGARAGFGYLAHTRQRAAGALERLGPDGGPAGAATRAEEWLELFDAVVAGSAADELAVGAWHGDWTEWNCGRRAATVRAWDWERYATAVPIGFDTLHFGFNRAVATRGIGLAPAARHLVDSAPRQLARWGLDPRAARTTALLYLLEIGLRYLLDDPEGRGLPARVEDWAHPVVRSLLAVHPAVPGQRS